MHASLKTEEPAASKVRNNLTEIRRKRGMTAAQLAEAVGVSRQTIYAIEASSYVPNTLVGLRLSRVLDTPVDQIFVLQDEAPVPPRVETVDLIAGTDAVHPGQPLRLCNVNGKIVAAAPEPGTWGLQPTDAILTKAPGARSGTSRATIVDSDWQRENRILLAGCDPAAALIARHLQRKGYDLIVTYQNSTRALELLKKGRVHIAGTHLLDTLKGESNLPSVIKLFGKDTVAVFAFAIWEEGIVVAHQNPKKILAIGDMARPGVRIVNREKGAGCRHLLDALLREKRVDPAAIDGYDKTAHGHLPAARMVLAGEADACISTRAAARTLGLDFVTLTKKRYDLVLPRKNLKFPPVQALIELLSQSTFRQEIEAATGYDVSSSGNRLL